MFENLRNWLYNLITRSGLVLHILPFLLPIAPHLVIGDRNPINYTVADEDGATVSLTRYNGKVYPGFGVKRLAGVKDLTIRPDDVMICGYPKSGCHWIYEIMTMILTRKLKLTPYGKEIGGMVEAVAPVVLDSLPSPRVLNSHLLYEDLPSQVRERKTKIVLTVRCPKDTVVSYYNHVHRMPLHYHYHGTFNGYFKLFMAGKLDYESYFDTVLSWDRVVKTQRNNPILVVEYEKLKHDPLSEVQRIATFLEKSISDEFADKIIQKCDFHVMKEKRDKSFTSMLFRKGQVGDWRNWLTDDQSRQIDEVWKRRMLHCSYQPSCNDKGS